MKRNKVRIIFFIFFSVSYFFWVSFGCLALKLNYEWQAVFFLMISLYMMLLVHATLTDIKYEPENKTKQEETENQGQ